MSGGPGALGARRIIAGASGYLLVGILERAFSVVIIPITTRMFTPSDFAQLIAVYNVTALLNLTIGMFFVRGATSALGICALLAPIISNGLRQPARFTELFRLGLAATLFATLGQTLMALSRAREQHAAVAQVHCLALLGQAIVILGLLWSGWGIAAMLWGALAAGAIATMGHWTRFGGWLRGRPTIAHLRTTTRNGAHLLASSLGIIVMFNSVGLILNAVGRADEAATFAVANGLASVGMLAAIAFNNAWTTYTLRRQGNAVLPHLAELMFEIYSLLFLVAGAAGCLFAHEIFSVLIGSQFVSAYVLVPPLICCYALFSFARTFCQGNLVSSQRRHATRLGLAVAAVYLCLGIAAAQWAGAMGLIDVMAAALGTSLVFSQAISYRAFPVTYPWKTHVAIWGATGLLVMLMAYLEIEWCTAASKLVVLSVVITFVVFQWRRVRPNLAMAA